MVSNGIIGTNNLTNVPAMLLTSGYVTSIGGADMASISCGIYKITNTVNGNTYIGSSSDLLYRWSTHKSHLKNNRHHSPHLQSAWLLYGADCFQFTIIEHCEKGRLIEREQYYIDTLRPVYNVSPTAGSVRGHKHTAAAIAKISHASRNVSAETIAKRVAALMGHVTSDETRTKISASMMGKNKSGHKPSQQAIENMRAAQKGHPVSQEQREKLRAANTGKKASPESKTKASASMFAFWKKKKEGGDD